MTSDETQRETSGTGDRRAAWVAVSMAGASIAITVGTVLVLRFQTPEDGRTTTPGLAVLLIGGILVFLFALGAVVAVFHLLNLTNDRWPLGLPDGSIQAFIALVLILLFFIMSVFLYTDITNPQADIGTLEGIPESHFNALPSSRLISVSSYEDPNAEVSETEAAPTLYDVTLDLSNERSQVADEVARQLITTIGTLIVAIASFYFGARSIGGRKGSAELPGEGV